MVEISDRKELTAMLILAWEKMAIALAIVIPWVVLIIVLLMLLFIPRMLKARRRRWLLKRLEQRWNSRVIAMIHRGAGPLRMLRGGGMIGLDEAETILKVIRETPASTSIDLILHTPGGMVLSTTQIARALKNHPAAVRVHIPHWAMSGGTLLSLAADEIHMDRNAVLGPVDPQTLKFPDMVAMASVLRVVREKSKDEIDDDTWVLADQAEKAIRQIEDFIADLLSDRLGPERARELGRAFTEGRWTHDYPLTWESLRDMGLNVSTELPEEVYRLLEALPDGARFRSVQWLPNKKKEAPSKGA